MYKGSREDAPESHPKPNGTTRDMVARIIAPEAFDPFLPATVMRTWRSRALDKAGAVIEAIRKAGEGGSDE
jgi:hypothetical protein